MVPSSVDSLADNIVVVLVEPSDPGNIGASARAMKTMGLRQLRLVQPLHFPHPKATWRATNALEVVEQAQVYADLVEAVSNCQLVFATSARNRSLPWPQVTAHQAGVVVTEAMKTNQRVALVFGRERSGLTNEELQQCHRHICISANSNYPVLNLSHAVQIVCYEIFRHYTDEDQTNEEGHFGVDWDQPLAAHKDIEGLLVAMDKMLVDTKFYNPQNPDKLVARLQRMFMRAGLDIMEVNIWRGIISHFQAISTRNKK